mmetsp:Transcript_30847/g.87226  ORF Transcript_30847/g.87226 Transcript_30847/m.87226 type:complete len:542 (-) Transcript_30847:852-2477(-)
MTPSRPPLRRFPLQVNSAGLLPIPSSCPSLSPDVHFSHNGWEADSHQGPASAASVLPPVGAPPPRTSAPRPALPPIGQPPAARTPARTPPKPILPPVGAPPTTRGTPNAPPKRSLPPVGVPPRTAPPSLDFPPPGSPPPVAKDLKRQLEVESQVPGKKEVLPLAGENVMKVVMVGAECAPWSKTGGLGDVMGALPKALAERGHRTMVVVPRYGDYENVVSTNVRARFRVFNSDHEVTYYHQYKDGVDYVFVDHSCFHGRGKDIYGGSRLDIGFRCALLCKAALEAPWHIPLGGVCYGDDNLVFIANDWHTALLPVYLEAHYRRYNQMTYARSMFVIHNMAHQGRGPFAELDNFEIPEQDRDTFFLDDPIGGEHMNIMKAGIKAAHRLVAVSHGYAWECQTQEGGWGLDQILREISWKFRGIVNGIDLDEWNPARDYFLQSDSYQTYTIATMAAGKAACKVQGCLSLVQGLFQNSSLSSLHPLGAPHYDTSPPPSPLLHPPSPMTGGAAEGTWPSREPGCPCPWFHRPPRLPEGGRPHPGLL